MTNVMFKTLHTIAIAAILVPLIQGPTPTPTAAQSGTIEAITIHPPVAARFQCSEHPLGAEDHVPDALAADCVVVRRDGGPSGNLASLYTGDGTRNEDWHSWREPLLAPFDGVVLAIQINPESTPPAFGARAARAPSCSSSWSTANRRMSMSHTSMSARSRYHGVTPCGQATRSPASGTTGRHSTPTCTWAHSAAT